MSITTIYPLSVSAPTTITRESYNNVGSIENTLGSIPRMFTAASFELWDSKTGGTELTLGVDYNLTSASSYYTTLASEAVNLSFQIINPTYQTGSLFATYDTIGSLTSAEFYNTIQESGSGLFRNAIINGNMEIAQRGTSFSSVSSGTNTLDRWTQQLVGTMVYDVTQDTDVPNASSKHSLKLDVTTADASMGAGDFSAQLYKIEGYDIFPFISKSVNISFYVKATKTGVYSLGLLNKGLDRSYIVEYTVAQSDVWEYKTISFIMDDGLTGTWDFTNDTGLHIYFTLSAGSSFETTADSWQTGTFLATSNQVNAMDNTANNFLLSQVQINEGSIALPFQPRHYAEELALCERYYEKSYDLTTIPGTVTINGAIHELATRVVSSLGKGTTFNVRKRSVPTIVLYSSNSGASGNIYNDTNGDRAGVAQIIGETGIGRVAITSGTTVAMTYQYTADAEL